MDLNKLNKVIRSISEKTKNRELLEKILKESENESKGNLPI